MYKICSWQEVLLFPKDQEQARISISVSIATTRWRQSQKDICFVDWHLLLRMQRNKTQNQKQRQRILRILSSKIPWWIWQKQNLMNVMHPTKKTKNMAPPLIKSCRASRVQIENLAATLPTFSKNPKPTFQSTYLSISILVFIHYWGKEIVLEKVLVLLARLVHLLEVSIKPSLLWIVDRINLPFRSCELEIMILKLFSFSFFELWVRTYNSQEWACIFEVVTKELWFLKVGLYFLFGVVWAKSYHQKKV